MKIIHQNGYTVDELAMYRLTIYKNLVDCAKKLVQALRQLLWRRTRRHRLRG